MPRPPRPFLDPYAGIQPGARIRLRPAMRPPDVAVGHGRRRTAAPAAGAVRCRARIGRTARRIQAFDHQQQRGILAVDLRPIPRSARHHVGSRSRSRQRYGMTLFGQATLAARRLVEAGSIFVTVFWDACGDNNAAWDTHYQHFPRMKDICCPASMRPSRRLILDLETRGLLDETLVLCFSEHGRTAKIDSVPGGWPQSLVANLLRRLCRGRHGRRTGRRQDRQERRHVVDGRCRPRTSWPPPITCWASTRTRPSRTVPAGHCPLWRKGRWCRRCWPETLDTRR